MGMVWQLLCNLLLGLFGENGGSHAVPYMTDARNLLGLMVELVASEVF